MRSPTALTRWDAAAAAFLSSRRALGRAYGPEERVLADLRAFLARAGATDLDERRFDLWRRRSSRLSPSTRRRYERTVYIFCRYRRRSERRCFLPDPSSFVRLRPYPLPVILGPEQIARLLSHASSLACCPRSPIRPAVFRLAIVLLYTAGLRRGELVRLTLDDADAAAGVLRIRHSKFNKSRWVPLSRSALSELRAYLAIRRRAGFDQGGDAPLLCSRRSHAYTGAGFLSSFHGICVDAGIRDADGRCPRVHDFRHSFAVAAPHRWYQTDADVQSNLPKLALYMGHVSIVSTAYYLRLMPAVVEQVGERFEHAFGCVVDGGAS